MKTRALVFDIWAEYAHMKKYYTTTSPLTFSIPPKTVVYGILGAILGLDKGDYLNYFQKQCMVGIQILSPIKKVRLGLNLINTKASKAQQWNKIAERTQIRTEYLKNPAYRLYIRHVDEELYYKLRDYLQRHISMYTISLGLSENLANFSFVGDFELNEVTNNTQMVEISTVFRIDDTIQKGDIDFSEKGKEYFSDRIALEMKPDREVVDYGQVVFERHGKPIRAKPGQYYTLSTGENILFI